MNDTHGITIILQLILNEIQDIVYAKNLVNCLRGKSIAWWKELGCNILSSKLKKLKSNL